MAGEKKMPKGFCLPSPLESIIFEVPEMRVMQEASHPGVYAIFSGDEHAPRMYAKRSDLLWRSFRLQDAQQAERALGMYRTLAERGFYDPQACFAAGKGDAGWYISAVMPAVRPLVDPHRDMGTKVKLCEEVIGGRAGCDVYSMSNYGCTDDGELRFFDLEVFRQLPKVLGQQSRLSRFMRSRK